MDADDNGNRLFQPQGLEHTVRMNTYAVLDPDANFRLRLHISPSAVDVWITNLLVIIPT